MSEEEKAAERQIGRVFDRDRPIAIRLQSADGMRTVTVRFPTDDEWLERQRHRKVLNKILERGKSQTIYPESEDFDGDLLARLRIGEEGGEVDGFEASRIFIEIQQAEVEDVAFEGGVYTVMLRVPGAVTKHTLQMPSAKDLLKFRRNFQYWIDARFKTQELVINLNVAAEYYRKLSQSVEGYVGLVPIIHQAAVVDAVMNELQSGTEVAGENF